MPFNHETAALSPACRAASPPPHGSFGRLPHDVIFGTLEGHRRERRVRSCAKGPAMVDQPPIPAEGAVTAAEHEQLRRDFAALRDQCEAVSEVLEAMGRSAADADTVLTSVV